LGRFLAARDQRSSGTTAVMYQTQQVEFRPTDRARFTAYLRRNGPSAVTEFERAQQIWAHRSAG
jgi:hypothetical protein